MDGKDGKTKKNNYPHKQERSFFSIVKELGFEVKKERTLKTKLKRITNSKLVSSSAESAEAVAFFNRPIMTGF